MKLQNHTDWWRKSCNYGQKDEVIYKWWWSLVFALLKSFLGSGLNMSEHVWTMQSLDLTFLYFRSKLNILSTCLPKHYYKHRWRSFCTKKHLWFFLRMHCTSFRVYRNNYRLIFPPYHWILWKFPSFVLSKA